MAPQLEDGSQVSYLVESFFKECFVFCFDLLTYSYSQLDCIEHTWALLYRCFPELKERLDVFSNSAINGPRNAMTVRWDVHYAMGEFSVAFEAVPVSQLYSIVRHKSIPILDLHCLISV